MPLLTCQRAMELQKDLPTLLLWYTFLLMFNFHGFNVERLLPANEVCILGERFAPDALWCGRQSPCPAVTTGYAPRRGRRPCGAPQEANADGTPAPGQERGLCMNRARDSSKTAGACRCERKRRRCCEREEAVVPKTLAKQFFLFF